MPRYFALIPAAGSGTRLGGERPKQYQCIAGRPMVRHALEVFCRSPRIERVFVVLSPTDTDWEGLDWQDLDARLTVLRCGGRTRAETVRNGLQAIPLALHADDWLLIHDAARPCLSEAHLERLIHQVADDAIGGILAVPVADTLKREAAPGRIAETVSRERLWQAQTPQMFRHGVLLEALAAARELTDESAALEALGHQPLLVESGADNLKVTRPADRELAEHILRARQESRRNS